MPKATHGLCTGTRNLTPGNAGPTSLRPLKDNPPSPNFSDLIVIYPTYSAFAPEVSFHASFPCYKGSMRENDTYISVLELSNALGLPLAWLKAEAKAGRIPSLQVGRRHLFNAEAVRRELAERTGNRKGGRGHD